MRRSNKAGLTFPPGNIWPHCIPQMGPASFISLGPHLSFTTLHKNLQVFQDRDGQLSILSNWESSEPLYRVARGFPLVLEGLEDVISSRPDPADIFILRQEIPRILPAPSYPCGLRAKPSLLLRLTSGSSYDIALQVGTLTCNSVCWCGKKMDSANLLSWRVVHLEMDPTEEQNNMAGN